MDFDLGIDYTFSSGIGSKSDPACYVTDYVGEVFATYMDVKDNFCFPNNERVGRISFKIIHFDNALNGRVNMHDVFDTEEYLYRYANKYFDFRNGDYNKRLQDTFPDMATGNICLIEKIHVHRKYRGKSIGAKIFKDLVWHFGSGCGLFVIQPFPLQFETNGPIDNFELSEFEGLEKDIKKATTSLSRLYQSWGFDKIKGIKDLLFYCPAYQNERLDSIDMDDF